MARGSWMHFIDIHGGLTDFFVILCSLSNYIMLYGVSEEEKSWGF